MEATEDPAEARLDKLKQEIEELKAKNTTLQHSLDDALSEVAVAGCVREDIVEIERQRSSLEAEKTTLESLLIEAQNEATSTRTRYEHENARVRAVLDQLETENRELKAKFVSDNLGKGGADLETLSVLTDATKSLARRVRSNLLPHGGGGSVSFSKHHNKSDNESDTSPTHDPTGMQKAYEDTELMKAIIVPLEEQIVALKDKLRETDTLLREFETHQSDVLFSAEVLGKWLVGKKSFSEAMEELEKRGQETHSVAFIALLNARLGLVIKELSELRQQNDRNAADLDRSLKKSADLRSQTAEAHGRLLKLQQKHTAELARVASVLSEEQKFTLSASLQKQNSVEKSDEKMMLSDEIVIRKSEWDALQDELNKTKALMGIGLDVDVVGSDQFMQLQSQLHEYRSKAEKNLVREEKLKSELQVMEQQWNQRAEEHQSQTTELSEQVRESKELLGALQRSYKAAFDESRAYLHKLTNDRDRIVNELKRLQVENDELLGKHHAKAEELQSEVINLPEKTEDMHLLLLTYREQLISAKLAAEHHEDKRMQTKAELVAETESLKERLLILESCKTEMEAVQKRSRDVESMVKSLRGQKISLEKELEASQMQKAKVEHQMAEMKARITNLQQELDNSVAVQTDFVRLSQSLQVELEKIRQSETEVRWQHEDDVDDCSSCHQQFSVSKRKHHCRHCGRIFCADCLTKTVTSGPKMRPVKVCEVCHTLLAKNSAPYFSTVVPSL